MIYNLRPVWYRSLCSGDRKDWSWYGLIAEEVAEIDPRLVTWSYLPEDYKTITTEISGISSTKIELKESAQLVPESVQYERLTIFLIKAVQELKEIVNIQNYAITTLNHQLSNLKQNISG